MNHLQYILRTCWLRDRGLIATRNSTNFRLPYSMLDLWPDLHIWQLIQPWCNWESTLGSLNIACKTTHKTGLTANREMMLILLDRLMNISHNYDNTCHVKHESHIKTPSVNVYGVLQSMDIMKLTFEIWS